MAQYNPANPALTLFGSINTVTNKDKYGVNDETGLGPNGADLYISFTLTVDSISSQPLGDASVRDSAGLNVGGSYDGIDVKVGDYISDTSGIKTYKITSISNKSGTGFKCVVQDVGMSIARSRSDRDNTPQSGNIIIYEVNDNNVPLFASNQTSAISAQGLNNIQSYFSVFEPFQRFTFYPDITGSLSVGDLVTITGSISGTTVSPYRLIPAKEDKTILGIVSDIYGGNNVNVRPYNKIITNFENPQSLTTGEITSIWYLSGSNGGYTTSSEHGNKAFQQLTLAIPATTTGSIDDPEFDETQYNFSINGVEVISQNAGGNTLTLNEITSSINAYSSSTYVIAGVDQTGGTIEIESGDTAGIGGVDGEYGYSSFTPTSVAAILTTSTTTPFPPTVPTAPGKFAITASGFEMLIHPTASSGQIAGRPAALASDFKLAIDSASAATGADLVTTVVSGDVIKLSNSDGSNIEITQVSPDSFNRNLAGNNSSTALPTGQFTPSTIENFLTLERADGGEILLEGSWLGNTTNSNGVNSVTGIPPYLLMLENDNDTLSTYYTGSLLDNKTQNINFSGSGVEVTTSGSDGILVDIKNDTLTSFYTGSEVLSDPTNKINFTGSGVEVESSGSDGILVTIDGGGSGGTYTNTDPTPINFPSDDDPNIPSGTTFSNKTFPEMMDLMLYPELDPTLTNPSNGFSISPSGLREIGETIATITLSATFNKGSISPAYGTTGFRSGDPDEYIYGGADTTFSPVSSTSLTDVQSISSHTVLSGANSWTGAVKYDAGPQPLTSKGNNFNSPLPAGTTSTITRTITGVYPVFATTSAIGTLTKQSLQVMTTYIQVSMVAETGNGDKQTIDIPDAWSTITGLQQFNTLSGTWDAIALSSFTTSATTQTIQGNSVNYTKYAYNGSTIGARQLRFTV